MHEIGEYIVKSSNGICKIEDIVHLNFSGADKKALYYVLIPVNDDKEKIYMPTETENQSVRKIMSSEEAMELIIHISDVNEIWVANEKVREQCYKEAVRSNNPVELIGIIKLIYTRKKERLDKGKKTTAIDEKYYRIAEERLYSELEISLHKSKEEVHKLIEQYRENDN